MARRSDSDLLKCSFCGKRNEQVKKMIAGLRIVDPASLPPRVYICNECIDLCNEIIETDIRDEELSETSHLKLEMRPTPQEILRHLEMAQFTEEEERVLRRIAKGTPYTEVANELGVSRAVVWQAAHRIFLECSFCERNHVQVKRLIAGPGVYICDECIELCSEIIEEELSEPSGQLKDPRRGWLTKDNVIMDTDAFTEQERQVMELIHQGVSEEKIAEKLGPDIYGQTIRKAVRPKRRNERPEDRDLK